MDWLWNLWSSNALLALGVATFLGGLGIPVPAALAIVATGALCRDGSPAWPVALFVGVIFSSAGDFTSYEIARRGLGRWIHKKQQKPAWRKAAQRFEKRAWETLFLSRWLLTPFALATAYLAGAGRYSRRAFLLASVAGHILWIGIYGGVGYIFADHWREAANVAGRYLGWIAAATVLIGITIYAIQLSLRTGDRKAVGTPRHG